MYVYIYIHICIYLHIHRWSISGTVAILFTGVAMRRYTYGNLSQEAQVFAEKCLITYKVIMCHVPPS